MGETLITHEGDDECFHHLFSDLWVRLSGLFELKFYFYKYESFQTFCRTCSRGRGRQQKQRNVVEYMDA
jgi:hypothetical protein